MSILWASGDKKINQNFGKYLKEKRVEADLSQLEVSRVLGYTSPQFISNIERGLCSPPMDSLRQMMKLYRISATEMTEKLMTLQRAYLSKALRGGNKKRA